MELTWSQAEAGEAKNAPEPLAEKVRLREAMAVLRQGLPADAMALVMAGNHLWSVMDIWDPRPLALIHLAQNLLEQAAELLPEGTAQREDAEYSAAMLQDRFGDDY
jgi:hypothetical protein